MRALALGLALATGLGGAALAEEKLDGGQVHAGGALELQLGARLVSFTVGGNTTNIGTLQGGIFGGYKIGRFLFGLGFDLARSARDQSLGNADASSADTTILFSPGLRVAIVRTADQRVELFGEFDLGFGHTFHEQSPAPTGPQPDTSNFHLNYVIGPGVRFWAHPHFAVAGLAALQGDFEFDSSTEGGVTTKSSTGTTGIAAQLQLLGVF